MEKQEILVEGILQMEMEPVVVVMIIRQMLYNFGIPEDHWNYTTTMNGSVLYLDLDINQVCLSSTYAPNSLPEHLIAGIIEEKNGAVEKRGLGEFSLDLYPNSTYRFYVLNYRLYLCKAGKVLDKISRPTGKILLDLT